MTQQATEGALLVAHGTVSNLDEMPSFLTAIRRGRPPSAELIEEMRRRYSAIGGSPLLRTTQAQARALEQRLGIPVFVGMRFGTPSLEAALGDALNRGIVRLVVVPMAPYSVHLYFGETRARLWAMPALVSSSEPLQLRSIVPYGARTGLVRAHAEQIRSHAADALAAGARLILSAHSLPQRVIDTGDGYERETHESAKAIGEALGVAYTLAYQSQGADGGRWLGPDLRDVISAAAEGARHLVVAPFGFLCDHVETLYDLDIETRLQCESLGITLHRVPALNLNPGLLDTLAGLVEEVLERPASKIKKKEVPSP